MPADHPLCGLETVSPSDLTQYPLISYSRKQPIGLVVDEQFKLAGIDRVVAIEITQSATACSLVAAGAGVAVVDSYALMNKAFSHLVVRPLAPAIAMWSCLLSPPAQEPSRLASAFFKSLESTIAVACKRGELLVQ